MTIELRAEELELARYIRRGDTVVCAPEAADPRGRARVASLVRRWRPPLEHSTREPSEVDKKIARRVAELVPDGAVIQMGIGAMPCAILDALHSHRRLGLHSGMVSDAVVDL